MRKVDSGSVRQADWSARGIFPVRVVHAQEDDADDEMCHSWDDLGLELEFHDEFSRWPLEVFAADGGALRVVAYALEVLFYRRVTSVVTAADLVVQPCVGPTGVSGFGEWCRGELHRVLWSDGRAEPQDRVGVPERPTFVAGGTLATPVFSQRWAESRASEDALLRRRPS